MGTGMALPWIAMRSVQLESGHIVEDLKMGVHLVIGGCGEPTRMILSGQWREIDLQVLRDAFERVTSEPVDVELDIAGLDRIDEAFIGLLMLLFEHQSNVGLAFRLASPGRDVSRTLKQCCADFLLAGSSAKHMPPI